jgi:hypothetical protein
MFLPQRTAFTMEAKLSSRRIISAACLATSVPVIPIAKPTSAFFRAGASFVPSPVTATTSPLSIRIKEQTSLEVLSQEDIYLQALILQERLICYELLKTHLYSEPLQ